MVKFLFKIKCHEMLDRLLTVIYSPVNLGFDLEQIATEMIFAGSNSLNSASQRTKSLRKSEHRKTTKFDIFLKNNPLCSMLYTTVAKRKQNLSIS